MKFHRITLRDYRGIRLLSFEPAETGVTIIQGENEVGKSSIAEALWLIFEQHDDSAGKAVSAIRPVDRDVASEVEVDVSSGPYRFTFFKRFHKGSRTELRIKQPRTEVLTGREADNRARQILGETIDVALWKALRFQQGVSDDLEQLPAGKHQSLLAALDAASDLLGGEREQTLFERVQQEYERYFTASGREKAAGDGPNAVRLRRARDAAALEAERLTERIITLEGRALRAAELDREIRDLEERRGNLDGRRQALQAALEERRRQESAVEALTSELRACQAIERESAAGLDARDSAASELAARVTELAAARTELERLAPALEAVRGQQAAAAAVLETAQETYEAARRDVDLADERVHLASAAFTAQTMLERLQRLEQNEPEAARLRAWLGSCLLDGPRLAAITRAAGRATELQIRREAEGATVEIAAVDGLQIEINGKPVALEPGRTKRGIVLGESQIALPGGVTITVRAGTAARELEADAKRAAADLERLLHAAGVDSVERAQEVVRERVANEATLRGLETQIAADLRDLGSVAELREKLERERARIEASRSSGPVPSIEAAKLSREEAGRALAAAELALQEGRATAARLEAAFSAQDRECSRVTESVARLEQEVERLTGALEAARALEADDALRSRVAEAVQGTAVISSRLEAARAELAATADVAEEAAVVHSELSALEASARQMADERAQIRGVLEDAGADGLHGQLTAAEQELAAAEDELEAYLKRANAARVLFEAMKRHRDAAKENYAGPLRQQIEALGKLAYGTDFGVELSDDLRVVRRTQKGVTLDVAQLSTGAREQLSVLTRLACASLVSDGGGAPLVLDDIFGWADPKRLKSLGPVLARAAGNTQVLLFTCTPGRFDSVSPARVISLPSGDTHDRSGDVPAAEPAGLASAPAPRGAPAQPGHSRQPQAAFELFLEGEPAGRR